MSLRLSILGRRRPRVASLHVEAVRSMRVVSVEGIVFGAGRRTAGREVKEKAAKFTSGHLGCKWRCGDTLDGLGG